MNEEARLLMNIWVSLEDFISNTDKPAAAAAIVRAFSEMGHEARELLDAEGEDTYLDAALIAQLEDEES